MDTSAAAAADASQVSQQAAQQANPWQWVLTIGIWVVVIAAAYFLFIRPQKKRQKAEEELRNSIEIGDDITTIGGIVGRVIAVKEDDETVVIETGSDKTRMRFKKWAIASVDTPEKQPKKEVKADKKADKKEDKKEDKKD
ncbi:MAG TPA: preprotein translocase subunit YajC [Ruminococcaceae bacterium]|nr:preprotein translocase subunit YajC [Oscillospiraceae bacterium]